MTFSSTSALIGAVLASALASPLAAQACLGARQLSRGDGDVGVGSSFTEDSRSYRVHLTVGSERRPFLTGAVSAVRFDSFERLANVLSLTVGRAFQFGPGRRLDICPLFGFERQNGPNEDTPLGLFKLSGRSFSMGGAIGAVVSTPLPNELVVFGGVTQVSSRTIGTLPGSTVRVSEAHSVVSVGAGLGVTRRLIVRPSASLPMGLEDGQASFGMTLSFGFGGGTTAQP